MAEGNVPDQEAIDDVRREARLEALAAIHDLEQFVRADDGMGGIDAIRIGVFSQQVTEKVRIYRMAVNVGDEPAQRERLADVENAARNGLGRRREKF
jgi:hypothetical protein